MKKCDAVNCPVMINVEMAFCKTHWNMLPRNYRDGIYAAKRRPERWDMGGVVKMACTYIEAAEQIRKGGRV